MAGANLLKKPADWSSLAAGVEVNQDGSGFRLTRLTDFFDITTDEGLTWLVDGSLVSWDGETGTIRSANNNIEIVNADQGADNKIYKVGFNVPGDFMFDLTIRGNINAASYVVGLTDNLKYPNAMISDGTSNALFFAARLGQSDYRAQDWTAGVNTIGARPAITKNTWRYVRLERVGSIFTVKVFSSEARGGGSLLTTSTVNPCTLATLTNIYFCVAFNGPPLTGTKAFGEFGDFELWNTGVSQRYLSTSPVATMGVVALPVGTIINGLGDLVEKLDGAAGISPEYNINNAGWVGPFASYAAMDADLLATPITITDGVNSVNVRHSHDGDGDEQAEVFVSEGPNLTGAGGGGSQAAIEDVRLGTIYNDGNNTGTLIVPVDADVRLGTGVDASVGSLAVPDKNDVRNGVLVDATTGDYEPVDEGDVALGVQYGSEGVEFTGELVRSFIGEIEIVEVEDNIEVVEV